MDRLSQLRGEAGGSRDSTLDTTSPPSEAFMTANESTSKFYSLSEDDSTFDISSIKEDISSIKDTSLASCTTESEGTMTNADELISNLSPIGKKSDILDSYKIDTQIEAANILSGGVAIFDDNDNSYDEHELVIDDNVEVDDKSNSELKQPAGLEFKTDENMIESSLISEDEDIASKDTEVVLQIDGKNVDAIDIGNGLYLYRKEGQEELAAVQIINDDEQQPSFKFLKVRENAEGNLEVYEEIEIEVPKEVPVKEGKTSDKNTPSHVPIKDINKVISESVCNKVAERKVKTPIKQPPLKITEEVTESKETSPDNKSEVNLNGKMMKFSESRKSPVIGTFTPMTYHSTPNKEGIPLTKIMVDQQLHPNRHSDLSNVKKTIEVHTDSCKQKSIEPLTKNKDIDDNKLSEISSTEKETVTVEQSEKDIIVTEETNTEKVNVKATSEIVTDTETTELNNVAVDEKSVDSKFNIKDTPESIIEIPMEQDNVIDSTENITKEETELESTSIDSVENITKEESIHIDNDNKYKNKQSEIIVNEMKAGENMEAADKTGELKLHTEESIDQEKVEVNKVDNKTDDEIEEAKALDGIPCVEENKEIVENRSQIQEKEIEVAELIKDKKEDAIDNVNDPILIDDDDVSVVEEVIVENNDDKCQEHITDREIKEKSDNKAEETQENIISVNNDAINVKAKMEESIQVDSTSSSVNKDSSTIVVDRQVEKNIAVSTEDSTLPVSAGLLNDSISASTVEIVKKDIESRALCKEPKAILIKSYHINDPRTAAKLSFVSEDKPKQPYTLPEGEQKQAAQSSILPENEQKQAAQHSILPEDEQKQAVQIQESKPPILTGDKETQAVQLQKVPESKPKQKPIAQLPIVSEDKQNNKSTKSAETKDAARKEKPIHVVPASISPLLEQKHQSLVAPKGSHEKSIALETNVSKITLPTVKTNVSKITLPTVKNMNTISFQKIESKTVELPQRKIEPVKESPPILAQMQVNSNVPITVAQSTEMHNPITEVRDTEIPNVFIQKPVKNTIDNPPSVSDAKYPLHRDKLKEAKLPTKNIASEKGKGVINIEISKVPKLDSAKTNVSKEDVSSTSSKIISQNVKSKIELKDKKEMFKAAEPKPINNNHAAVPFGKWTEANRQEFLNKFKTKTSVTSSSSNQLKNSNDLNRRDVLKKIDSQRSNNALSKTQEANRLSLKPETAAFSNKPNTTTIEIAPESKIAQKTEMVEVKPKTVSTKNITTIEVVPKTQNESAVKASATGTTVSKIEVCQRTGVVQNLIDKTIEGMIHRTALVPKAQDEPKQTTTKEATKTPKPQQTYQRIEQATLDAIEMKMNELHGIPFIERPPHELPQVYKTESKSFPKVDKEKLPVPIKSKVPNLLPFPNKNQLNVNKEGPIEVDSEDENIIEHEPITGDIDLNKKTQEVKSMANEKLLSNTTPQIQQEIKVSDAAKKESIITEKDFDKFARRNSITYENCLTMNFDGKEPHNVVQTVVEKDPNPKNYSRNDSGRIDPKAKPSFKYQNVTKTLNQPVKPQPVNKLGPANDDASNRNQSKLQKAYQSALTAKRQMTTECPITIIEDKPVKVVFMDSVDYVPSQLNVQGQDLSPAKRAIPESDVTISTCDSLDSDIIDSIDDAKSQDEIKTKTKHQRKQVLTPVEEPELELIEPRDLGIAVSPKKKRKTEDDKTDKNLKMYPMRKKMYLLGAVTEEKIMNPVEILKNPLKETVNLNDNCVANNNPVSALDSLVKAAELIETQMENKNTSIASSNTDSNPGTPVKRGRGRPRKYPLTPDGTIDKSKALSEPSPQKKPRLIDAKTPKREPSIDKKEDNDEIIKENWTMGKINEKIICPICNKLFRAESIVYKHVKHCTGPSPSRSDSDTRSPKRIRKSQDFDTKSQNSKSDDMDIEDEKPLITRKDTPKKQKSKDSITNSDNNDDVIVIEDTPIKEIPENFDERKHHESRKLKTKIPPKTNDLVCEFCGKTFRQLSYLVSHKMQHKKVVKVKADPKQTEKDAPVSNKSVYSCEVCKKEFRKLHHLVQHRIIHNPSVAPVRSSRKSSSEQSESKVDKEPSTSKQSDDSSAGFRCEPCDKSFRKLHHLVEHRETHDGINRQKTSTAPPTKEEKVVEKTVTLHQCDVCKKTFRKLQHLNEHKEQHVETSSDKSDDKSVKSSLSTKDIIHECSLCYMVFPNEHSLNKHTVFCQRKKRQSKQLKPTDESEGCDEATASLPAQEIINIESPITILEDSKQEEQKQAISKLELAKDIPLIKEIEVSKEKSAEPIKIAEKEKVLQKLEPTTKEQVPPAKREFVEVEPVETEAISVAPEKIKKIEEKVLIKIHETTKKKTPLKEKTATKRLKAVATPILITEHAHPVVESSDDDEVRYMLNPNFKAEEVTEEKVFMKVRAKKRSSLQIERPNSKDLVKRRTSLQHPPKIPRLKPKAVEVTSTVKKEIRIPKVEPLPSTDSDDSESTKYSFPATIPEKPTKSAQDQINKDSERKLLKKSLADKRKSLSGIAKRKSLGKAVTAKHKVSPLKQIKKRTLDVEHRCDCGQLFSSAALLSRHTTLAHTPPRIRRRRSPPPEEKPVIKPAPRKPTAAEKPKQIPVSRTSSARSDCSTTTNTKSTKTEVKGKKSLAKGAESPSDRKSKTEKSEATSSVKPRRSGAHRGVPVPEKMRKLMHKK